MWKLNIIKSLAVAAILAAPVFSAQAAELKFKDQVWEVEPTTTQGEGFVVRNDFGLAAFLKKSYSSHPFTTNSTILNQSASQILEEAAQTINQEARDAKLIIKDGWAEEFEPGQNGQVLDKYLTQKTLTTGLKSIDLPVIITRPEKTLAETNNLGIKELVGVGESDFSGSPYNRRVNVNVGASKYQGLILKPGEEFSFNQYLGDVDAKNGFLPELVIKRTGLVPEFGGGLCQVSSTAFRAAMNAGLPITERRNHSFAVQYYAPQGTDATIYPGVTDFKFKNDLPSHLLIRTKIEGNKLYYEYYGTKDQRKISFDGPHQYDKRSDGAMKAIWTRWVEQNGEKKEQVFRSTYQPPALFQRTTQSDTPNPDSNQTPTPTPTETPSTETPTNPDPTPTLSPTPTPEQN
jgi:vancomycin resistance protein YoaR